MASKKPTAIAAQRPVAPLTATPDKGLWLDISMPLGTLAQATAAEGLAIAQSVQLVPGQAQTLPAHMARRYRLVLRGQAKQTEPLAPSDQTVLVLRQGEDLWLSNAQAAGLVLSGFFTAPDNQLQLDHSTQPWTLDGLSTGTPIAGTDAQLLHWHGQAEQWPDVFNVSTSEGEWALHKTQWQAIPTPAPVGEAASGATASGASTATSGAATATSGAASATGDAASTSGAAAAATSGTATQAAGAAVLVEATAATAVGVSGAAVGAAVVGVGAIAAASSGKKVETTASTTPSTPSTPSNLAPTAVALTTALTNNAILETASTTNRTKVADIGITDDALGTNTITLTGADAASFEVVGSELYLKAGVALNYESKTSYAVTVNVADSTVTGSTALSTNYTLAVTDANEAPTAVALTTALTNNAIAENTSTATRTKVADIGITDDALGTNTITLSGADAASFEVVGSELYLKAGVALNYESKTSYAVTVNVADSTVTGSTALSTNYTLSVTDANEAPTAVALTSALTNNAILETASTATRTKVADIGITDDALGTNTITLTGADAASFEVVGSALYLKAGVALNYENKTSYAVTVNVADSSVSGSTALSTNYTLAVTDVNEAPSAATGLSITASGGNVVSNTLNSTNTAIDLAAAITATQATGGKAEFYVGSTLVGTDSSIASGDTSVDYTTSDGTPSSAELQAAIASGGVVSVKLFDAAGNSVTTTGPTLVRDLIAPSAATGLSITASGGNVVSNTLNSTNTAIDLAAAITATQATGGKAEFYVGSTLVGTDSSIASGDTSVDYTTSDGTPSSAELQAAIASGGVVSVKLFDAAGNSVTSTGQTLVRDLVAPSAATGLSITASGGNVVSNTLNSTNTAIDLAAAITATQATGGKAEFYVGSTLVGTDSSIASGDTSVDYTTSDGTPSSAELQAAIASGGVVSVKLFDAAGNSVTTTGPTLVRDLIAPSAATGLSITASGGNVVSNTLNSTNTAIDLAAAITATQATGGKAEFYVGSTLVGTDSSIASGDTSVDYTTSDGTPSSAELQAAIASGGVVSVKLFDAAGNSVTTTGQTLVRDVDAPSAATGLSITASGGNVVSNTLNSTNTAIDLAAAITATQATGGKAEFYVGSTLVGTDSSIASGDTSVDYTTSDGTPSSAELQAAIASGGVVSVKLFDAAGNSVTTTGSTLVRDLVAPSVSTVTDTTSASVTKDAITFTVTFDGAITGTVGTSNFTASTGTVTAVNRVGTTNAYTVVVTPTAGVASGSVALSLVGTGLTDANGNAVADADLSVFGSQAIDTKAPAVSTVTDATAAAVTKDPITFTVTFDEAVVGTVGTGSFTATNGTVSSVTRVGTSNAYTVVVTPTAGLASGTVALSLVGTGLADAAGNAVASASLSSLGSQAIDTLGPTLVSSTPADGADFLNTSNLVLNFNEPIALGSSGLITLKNLSGGSDIVIDLSNLGSNAVTASGSALTINPGTDLVAGQNYAVNIQSGVITDAASNAYAGIASGDNTTLNFNAKAYALGQATISLGSGNGQLIAPVQVEGNWYYFWDRNGNGNSSGDGVSLNALAVLAYGAGSNGTAFTATNRSFTINGVSLLLPTLSEAPYATLVNTAAQGGGSTSVAARDATPNSNASHTDLAAIWDAHNSSGSSNGAPPGWGGGYIWAATPGPSNFGSDHKLLEFGTGTVAYDLDWKDSYAMAFQVL